MGMRPDWLYLHIPQPEASAPGVFFRWSIVRW